MKTRLEIYKDIYRTSLGFYFTAGFDEDKASRKANIDAVRQTDAKFYKQYTVKRNNYEQHNVS